MPIVTNYLLAQIRTHLDRHHVVVWFDPEGHYTTLAHALADSGALPAAQIVCYDPRQGFLTLRRELEPIWRGLEPPRLLIYAPLSSKDSHNALAEYLAVGLHLEPGQPSEANTRLSVVARQALKTVLPPAALDKLIDEVDAGKLSLAEIEAQAERGQDAIGGVLSVIFQTVNAEEIALRFLTAPTVDPLLTEKSAGPTLAGLLGAALDLDFGSGHDLPGLRSALARRLLVTDLILSLGRAVPPALQTIPLPGSSAARATAVKIVQTWRQRRDLAAAYSHNAAKIEAELSLSELHLDISALQNCETFLRLEKMLQMQAELALTEKPTPQLLELARLRIQGFWASQEPLIKLRWQVMISAAQVLLQAQAVHQGLKTEQAAGVLFKRYTADNGWYALDTAQRHLERDAHNYDLEPTSDDSILKLVAAAQRAYADTTHLLANRFLRAYESAGFALPGVTQQVEIYHDFIEPAGDVAVAYFLVDAFRYEMAQELCSQLPADWKAEITPALATPPTITEIGMAALMPQAERGITITGVGVSKLGVQVSETLLKARPDRVRWLEAKGHAPVVVIELNKIAPLKDNHLREALTQAHLVVVTASDEIDGLWENQPHTARRLHEDVFEQLRRGMRTLFNLGLTRIILTADHGFLMGDRLMQGEALDAPGGETADLHRRMWVGKGGAAVPECLRRPLSAFGIGGDLELVTPYGLNIFKSPGGSTEYFHGGLSLPEMVIPIVTVTPGKTTIESGAPAFQWAVEPGSQKITTRFFTVTVKGGLVVPQLFAQAPRLHAELRAGSQVISVPIAASYGFNELTREVTMKFREDASGILADNAITLQITEEPKVSSVMLYLLDEFGASLYSTSLPFAIAL